MTEKFGNRLYGETLDRLTEEAAGLLREMVAIPSPSFGENAVCRHVSSFLERCGIGHTVVNNNIVAVNANFCPSMRSVMLSAHLDTVPPCEGYSFDPYSPEADRVMDVFGEGTENVICGLGSNDDGGSVVSMIAVMKHFYRSELPVNLILVLNCEEERSGPHGMEWIWGHFNEIAGLEHAARPEWAVIGEPTGMKAAASERGLLVLDGTAEGVSGHAGRGDGVNAIYIALDDIAGLKAHEFVKVSPVMGRVRMNVTQIEAGSAHNVIPDRCSFTVDIRPTEMYGNREILDELRSICKSRLEARNLGNSSSATSPDSPLLVCAEALGIGTFSSPTTSDWMRIGCDAIKMGPGESSRSHRKDEFITIDEISEGISGYAAFLEKFFSLYPDFKGSRGNNP